MPFDDTNFSRIGNVPFLFFLTLSLIFTSFQLGAAVLDTESSNSKWNTYLPQNKPELSVRPKAGSVTNTDAQIPKWSFLPPISCSKSELLIVFSQLWGMAKESCVYAPNITSVSKPLNGSKENVMRFNNKKKNWKYDICGSHTDFCKELKNYNLKKWISLARWLTWFECHPVHQKLQVRSPVWAYVGGNQSIFLYLKNKQIKPPPKKKHHRILKMNE